jgi:Predicted integral membrane protein (DUF2269)
MTTLAVQFYDVIVWLHVSSVVIAFGPTFAFGIYLAMTGRNHPRSLPAVIEAQNVVTRTMVTIGGVLVLLTGIYLTADRWDFGYFFVTWGLIAIIVLLGLAHGFFLPHDRRALAAAKRDIEAAGSGEVDFGEEFNRASGASARMGPISGLIVILTIYVMAAKPFL